MNRTKITHNFYSGSDNGELDAWRYANGAIVAISSTIGDQVEFGEDARVDSCSIVRDGSCIGDAVVVGPYVVVGRNVSIGDESRIGEGVFIDDDVWIGEDVVISSRVRVGAGAIVGHGARIGTIRRRDGHVFCYVPCADGNWRVGAGCRWFTMPEARDHWSTTRGGTPLGDETMAILDMLERLAVIYPDGV